MSSSLICSMFCAAPTLSGSLSHLSSLLLSLASSLPLLPHFSLSILFLPFTIFSHLTLPLLLFHFHFRFQFSDPTLSPDHSVPPVNLSVSASGRSHGLVVWWDMMLGDTPLSMEPWKYPQWRDHWLQAVYLWPQPIQVKQGMCLFVCVCARMRGRRRENGDN